MLYIEKNAVCSEIHIKHIKTLCGQYVEYLNVNLVVDIVTTGLNVLNLCYKNQSVNVVYGNKGCLFRNTHKTHKHSDALCIIFVCSFLIEHTETTRLLWANVF